MIRMQLSWSGFKILSYLYKMSLLFELCQLLRIMFGLKLKFQCCPIMIGNRHQVFAIY